MSLKEFLLPDGRRTSELKVTELKKELEKYGMRKTGPKCELLNRLNQALSDVTSAAGNDLEELTAEAIDDPRVQYDGGVGPVVNGDTEEEEMAIEQEDRIEISISTAEEAEMTLENTATTGPRCPEIEAGVVTIESTDAVMTIEEKEQSTPEIEEGEVVSVPITARLGKRRADGDLDSTECGPQVPKVRRKGLKETRGSGHVTEEPERVQPPRQARYRSSNVLKVSELVRPFTVLQLKTVLQVGGTVIDMWLSKLKSVAYAQYEHVDAATKARESLDGCRWPSINPKLLEVDFSTAAELAWAKESGDRGAPVPAHLRPTVSTQDRGDHSYHNENDRGDGVEEKQGRHGGRHITGGGTSKRRSLRRDSSDRDDVATAPPGVHLLEDLFMKTRAQPAIYWLPSASYSPGDRKVSERRKVPEPY